MMFLPVAIGTGLAILIGVIFMFFTPGPDKALNKVLIITALFMMWLMWVCVYLSQMYPVAVPEKPEEASSGLF
jgi:uncharacterized membrane protein